VEKLGGNRRIDLDIRVIAATNLDPMQAVKEGKLREDLYYRLNVFQLSIAPLRERVEDIELLAHYFLAKRTAQITTEAVQKLQAYPWPGNVRELENVLERASILAGKQPILVKHLPADVSGEQAAKLQDIGSINQFSIPKITEQIEKKLILEAIANCNGNKSKAATLLEISERSLWYKLSQYQIS
jgi:two-component system response regulator AtoC